jgi:hypothetical protein
MALGQRQLFIYWRVASADLPAALTALREWQSDLVALHPELRCGLYRRSDGTQADATVMESYAIESAQPHPGVGEELLRHIRHDGDVRLKAWLRGARHVEVFDALPA